jgi:hypothetical protein
MLVEAYTVTQDPDGKFALWFTEEEYCEAGMSSLQNEMATLLFSGSTT